MLMLESFKDPLNFMKYVLVRQKNEMKSFVGQLKVSQLCVSVLKSK
jgi:hypothetical protein